MSDPINSLEPRASVAVSGWTVVRGAMTALIGMGDPPQGSASAHHLIRADYDFICWVYDFQVRKITINRLQ